MLCPIIVYFATLIVDKVRPLQPVSINLTIHKPLFFFNV